MYGWIFEYTNWVLQVVMLPLHTSWKMEQGEEFRENRQTGLKYLKQMNTKVFYQEIKNLVTEQD